MNIQEFFEQYNKVALAFSGGVDSAYLLYAALKYGVQVRAYYVKTPFQPEFEYRDACRLAEELQANMTVIYMNVLEDAKVVANPKNRCYYCKTNIFQKIKAQALADGFTCLLDGTNASDEYEDRPGMKALEELQVLSPLRICGLTKARIRELSKEAGLFTWDKPAYACLATRIPAGEEITADKLLAVEKSEEYLMQLGFADFRVRIKEKTARLQVKEAQISLVIERRKEILEKLGEYFDQVTLDLEVR